MHKYSAGESSFILTQDRLHCNWKAETCMCQALQQQFQHHNAPWNRSTEMKPESILYSWSCFMTHARTPFCPAAFFFFTILQQTWMHSWRRRLSRLSYSTTFSREQHFKFRVDKWLDMQCGVNILLTCATAKESRLVENTKRGTLLNPRAKNTWIYINFT